MSGRKTPAADKPRVRIATYGPRGRTVKVFKETGWLLVRVQWSDALGLVETKSWPNTRAGIAEAKAWATAFSAARELPTYTAPSRITLRELWEAYVTAEFPHLRETTKDNYTGHWHTWELFAGRALEADLVTPEMLDELRGDLSTRKNAKGEPAPVAISQQRQVVSTVKRVFKWGIERALVTRERILLYRFKVAKEQRPQLVPEYSNDEHAAIVAELNPRLHSQWRAWALTVIAGELGPRINAALHLTWADIELPFTLAAAPAGEAPYYGTVTWRSEFDKLGNVRVQPLTAAAHEAFLVALGYARHNPRATGSGSDWIFFTPATKDGKGDGTYTVQAAWRALREAEIRAHVTHQPRRAFHGGRRMASGNALEATNNPVTAMQWIGDTDLKQAKKYLKERDTKMRDVAGKLSNRRAPAARTAPERPVSNPNATATPPENTTAPVEAGAVSDESTRSYE